MFKKHKVLSVILTVFIALVVIIGAFLLFWFCLDSYEFDDFKKEFSIEDALDENAVPQGLGNYGSTMLMSAYMADGSASRVYAYDAESGNSLGYVTMRLPEAHGGGLYDGHAGGIAADEAHVWLSMENTVYVMDRQELFAATASNGEIEIKYVFSVDCGADFAYYNDGMLYIGEFYKDGDYETKLSHHVTSPAGDALTAVYYCFETDKTKTSGLADLQPEYAVAITEKIQGMSIINGYVVLSQSWGPAKSHLLVYNNINDNPYSELAVDVDGTEVTVPLYALDSNSAVNDYAVPSMSEGLCVYDGRVYVLFENASVKYKLISREPLTDVYSFIPTAE